MTRYRNIRNVLIMPLIFFVFLIIPSFASAVEDTAISSDSQIALITQGKVKNFNPKNQLLLLKTNKGERMSIVVDWNTALIGYSTPQEIEKDQKVTIWYSLKADKKIAIKIEQKLVTGC